MEKFMRRCGAVLPAVMFLSAVAASAAERGMTLGKQIQEFSLQDFRGRTHSLAEHAEAPVIVIYFMGTECPLAKLYAPRMQRLANRFAERQVVFLGINSNVQDSITELSSYARLHRVRFPVLKDVGNRVADQFGATRTPQVFVLDAQRKIRYLGRIDSQYSFGSGVGLAKPKPAREDLAVAIEPHPQSHGGRCLLTLGQILGQVPSDLTRLDLHHTRRRPPAVHPLRRVASRLARQSRAPGQCGRSRRRPDRSLPVRRPVPVFPVDRGRWRDARR